MDPVWSFLFDIIALLGVSVLCGGVFSRFGQSPLVGYILAGMLVGGGGSFQVVQAEREIEAIAELGVSLLLFSLGLEFSLGRLKALGKRVLWGGVYQVVATTVAGSACAALFGLSAAASVAVGMMISLSSTACVLRVLMERAELDTSHGRNSLGVLLVQDIAVVPLAILMSLLAVGGTPLEILTEIARICVFGLFLVLSLYLLLVKFAVFALGMLTLERNRELTTLLAVVTGLGSAWAAHEGGISPALGAFVAGMFLGGSPFATQIRADVSTLRVLLLTLFFGGAGMTVDPIWILKNWYLVLGATALLVAGKTAILWGIFRLLKQPHRIAVATGLCLAQIGEFAFVLGSIARKGEVFSPEILQLLLSTAIVSLFISPFLIPVAPAVALRVAQFFGDGARVARAQSAYLQEPPDVVIVGFGPAGRIAASAFVDRPEKILVIDLNHEGVRSAREMGFLGTVGDATQAEILEHARVGSAKLIVITVPHHKSAHTILDHARRLAPQAQYLVRSRYQIHTEDFLLAGAHAVLGDEEEIGKGLARFIDDSLDRKADGKSSPG
jgi:CPA2 family monovalent cation:H+ antiporter-2